MSVWLHEERASVTPFGPGRRTRFTPDRIAIETLGGELVAERLDPRSTFAATAWRRVGPLDGPTSTGTRCGRT